MDKKTTDIEKIKLNYLNYQSGMVNLAKEFNEHMVDLVHPDNLKRDDFQETFNAIYFHIEDTLDEIKLYSEMFFEHYKDLDTSEEPHLRLVKDNEGISNDDT
tara:strand:- start:735 stop:1040 length:306 start_codon:yes stop_codon:yes gene_type:complete